MMDLKKQLNAKDKLILCLVAVIWMAGLFIFCFSDMTDCLDNGVMLYQAIRVGQFRHFYTYSLEHCNALFAANYELPIYAVFMLWNLPTAIAADHGFDYMNSMKALIWCKLLIVVMVFICLYLMRKIYKEIATDAKIDRVQWYLLFFSSPLIFLPPIIICQYDCIGMVFILAGLYFYLKNKNILWVVFFSFAFLFKGFSLLVFIPLLLYKEKNIFKQFIKAIGMFVPFFLLRLIFSGDTAYTDLIKVQSIDASKLITSSVIKIGVLNISPFIAVYAVICLWCFMDQYRKEQVIYICASVFVAFVLLTNIRGQWAFLCEPFIILIMVINTDRFRENVFIHAIGGSAGIIYRIYAYPRFGTNIDKLLLGRILTLPHVSRYGDTVEMFQNLGIDHYCEFLHTVYFMMFALLMIINHPSLIKKKLFPKSDMPAPWLSFLGQTVAIYVVVGLLIYTSYTPGKVPVYNALTFTDYELCEGADLSRDVTISQPFMIGEDSRIDEIDILFNLYMHHRYDKNRIEISVTDEDGNILSCKYVLNCSLESDEVAYIKIPEVTLRPGRYQINLRGIPRGEPNPVYPYLDNSDETGYEPALLNGKKLDHALFMAVK